MAKQPSWVLPAAILGTVTLMGYQQADWTLNPTTPLPDVASFSQSASAHATILMHELVEKDFPIKESSAEERDRSRD